MAYTFPNPAAADVSFAGATLYVFPSPTAADVDFVDATPTTQSGNATGFNALHFGTPTRFVPPTITSASALRALHFGTPTRPGTQTGAAQGLPAVRFGRPTRVSFRSGKRHILAHAYRLRPVKFGTPSS
jgi:hypothetical protein